MNGFCDYINSTDNKYGNFTWIESVGGATSTKPCIRKRGSFVQRRCFPNGDGWSNVDYTDCRESKHAHFINYLFTSNSQLSSYQ